MSYIRANEKPDGLHAAGLSGLASARVGISLARLHLCRAWLRFSRQLHRSSPFLFYQGQIR
jgi:hypothetical protein